MPPCVANPGALVGAAPVGAAPVGVPRAAVAVVGVVLAAAETVELAGVAVAFAVWVPPRFATTKMPPTMRTIAITPAMIPPIRPPCFFGGPTGGGYAAGS